MADPTMSYDELTAKWRVGSGDWSWEEEGRLLRSPANAHTSHLTELIEEAGAITDPVLLGTDGRVWDGHHRVVIAEMLGIPIPYELAEDDEDPGTPFTNYPDLRHPNQDKLDRLLRDIRRTGVIVFETGLDPVMVRGCLGVEPIKITEVEDGAWRFQYGTPSKLRQRWRNFKRRLRGEEPRPIDS